MPHPDELRLLRREVQADLAAVDRLMGELADARRVLPPDPPQATLAHIGYLLHGVYTDWESAFHRIAAVFENRLDPSGWHVQLLRRMTLDIPGIRPAVIDARTCEHLAALRSFRHFFRHGYAVPLRWPKMQSVLEDYDAAASAVAEQHGRFLTQVERIADQSEERPALPRSASPGAVVRPRSCRPGGAGRVLIGLERARGDQRGKRLSPPDSGPRQPSPFIPEATGGDQAGQGARPAPDRAVGWGDKPRASASSRAAEG